VVGVDLLIPSNKLNRAIEAGSKKLILFQLDFFFRRRSFAAG